MQKITGDDGRVYVELDATTEHETEKAVKLDLGYDEPQWVPKSQLEDWPGVGRNGTILVTTWWAEKEGLV